MPPRGVSRHRPNRLFTRVINARPFSDKTIRDGPRSGKAQVGELQQAEFSRPPDRRAAVLNAQLAVHGALVGLHGIRRDV